MEFTMKTNVLLNVVKKLATIADADQLVRVTKNGKEIVFETFSRKTSSFLKATVAEYNIESLSGDGVAVFQLRRFKVVIELCPTDGFVSVNSDANTTTIDNGRSKTIIKNVDESTFKESKEITGDCVLKAPAAIFSRVISESSVYVDNDNPHYALGSVLLTKNDDDFVAVATDGKALNVMPFSAELITGELQENILLPATFCSTLARLCSDVLEEIEVAITPDAVAIKWEGFHYQSCLIAGRFPQWKRIVPDVSNSIVIKVNRSEVNGVIGSVLKLNDDKFKRVTISLRDNAIDFSMQTETTCYKESIETTVKASGDIRFDATYFKWVANCPSESSEVTFKFNGANKPALMEIDDKQLVVMPLSK